MKNSHDVIISPIITEASMARLAEKKYTFKVASDANKIEIKKTNKAPVDSANNCYGQSNAV